MIKKLNKKREELLELVIKKVFKTDTDKFIVMVYEQTATDVEMGLNVSNVSDKDLEMTIKALQRLRDKQVPDDGNFLKLDSSEPAIKTPNKKKKITKKIPIKPKVEMKDKVCIKGKKYSFEETYNALQEQNTKTIELKGQKYTRKIVQEALLKVLIN